MRSAQRLDLNVIYSVGVTFVNTIAPKLNVIFLRREQTIGKGIRRQMIKIKVS